MIAMIVKRAYYFLSPYFRSVFFFCFFVHTGGGRSSSMGWRLQRGGGKGEHKAPSS